VLLPPHHRDLRGEFALLYFGFTFCPDICPEELEKVALSMDQVEQKASAASISVDPEHATHPVLATPAAGLPRLFALTSIFAGGRARSAGHHQHEPGCDTPARIQPWPP